MKKKNIDWNLKAAIACILIIAVITALSGSNIGWKVEKQAAASVKLSDVVVTKLEGEPYGTAPGTPIYTIKITNTFIPRQYDLPNFNICLYNTELKRSSIADAKWTLKESKSQYDEYQNTIEVKSGTKKADLLVFQGIRYKPIAAATEKAEPVKAVQTPEVYDQLLLFIQEKGKAYNYRDCSNLQEADFKEAIIIPIVK